MPDAERKSRSIPPERMMIRQTVHRDFPDGSRQLLSSVDEEYTAAVVRLSGTQITESENHPGWNRSHRTGAFAGDIGGPFKMQRKTLGEAYTSYKPVMVTSNYTHSGSTGSIVNYSGPCFPINPMDAIVSIPSYSDTDNSILEALGTKAIAIVKPTNSVADVITSLAEIYREGLPKVFGKAAWGAGISANLQHKSLLKKDLRKGSRAAAQENLNLEFGIKPLINDIADVAKSVKDADKILAQYERDAGRLVRRRFEFPIEESITSTVIRTNVRPFMPQANTLLFTGTASGKVLRIDEIRRRRWFSGAFTYFLPKTEGMHKDVQKADKLLGIDLTPEVLWNLAPWTWAIDWFTNLGSIIENFSDWATDGLVLKYGYIMEHSFHKRTYAFEGPSGYAGDPRPGSLEFVVETKKRVQATPYGFGLTWESFTPRQLAILASLGVTKFT